MNPYPQSLTNVLSWIPAVAALLAGSTIQAAGADTSPPPARAVAVVTADRAQLDPQAGTMVFSGSNIAVRVSPARLGEPLERRETSWLGAAVEEAPEVLTAQLGLDPGVGLVVVFVATNSPSARAGLEKNDVLVELNDQKLFHPLQFRKMIQVRKEGDEVKLTFYRAGKQRTVTAKLEKAMTGFGPIKSTTSFGDGSGVVKSFTSTGDPFVAIESSGLSPKMKFDELRRWLDESRRNIDQARRAYEQAVRSGTNSQPQDQIENLRKALEELARSQLALDDKATVTVRSTGSAAKSIVKADESGTIVIVKNPKLRLTAHDKDGKLLYDGEIETPDQRAQVPPELWKKVEPLLDKMNSKSDELQAKPAPFGDTSSR